MCEKCRVIFGEMCSHFLSRQIEQFDDPVEVIEAFIVQSVGSVYDRLGQMGVTEADAKLVHDKVISVIGTMNTQAMRDRILGGDAPSGMVN